MKKMLSWLLLFAFLLGCMPGRAAQIPNVANEIENAILPWAMTLEEMKALYPDGEDSSYEIDGVMTHLYTVQNVVPMHNQMCDIMCEFDDKGLHSFRCDRMGITSLEDAWTLYHAFANGLSTLFGVQFEHDPYWEDSSKKNQYGSDTKKALADGAVSQITAAYWDEHDDFYFIWLLRHSATDYQVLFDIVPSAETLETAYQSRMNGTGNTMLSQESSLTVSTVAQTPASSLLPAPWGSSMEMVHSNVDFQGTKEIYQATDGNTVVDYPVLLVTDMRLHDIPFNAQFNFSGEGFYSFSYGSFAPGYIPDNDVVFEHEESMNAFYEIVDELTETMQTEAFFTYQWVDEAAEKQYAMRVDQALKNGKLTSLTAYFENAEQFVQVNMSAERFDVFGMSLTVADPVEAPPAIAGTQTYAAPQPTAMTALPQIEYANRVKPLFEIVPGSTLEQLTLYMAAGMIMPDDYTIHRQTEKIMEISLLFQDAEYRMNYSCGVDGILEMEGEVTLAQQEREHYQATYEMIYAALEEIYGSPYLEELSENLREAYFYAGKSDIRLRVNYGAKELIFLARAKNQSAAHQLSAAAAPQRIKPEGLSPFSFDWGSDLQTVKNGLPQYTESTADMYAGVSGVSYPYVRSSLMIGNYKFQTAYSFSGAGLCWVELWLNSANKSAAYAAYSAVLEMFTDYCGEENLISTDCTWKNSNAESNYGSNIKQAWRDGKITDIATMFSLEDSFYQILLNDWGITVYCQGILIPSPLESAP